MGGVYKTTETLVLNVSELNGSDRFNSVSAKIVSEKALAIKINSTISLSIRGLAVETSAVMTPEDSVVLVEGCTYYEIKNIRLSCTKNSASNKTGTGLTVVPADTRFSGYGYIEGVIATYFDTGIKSVNTLVKIRGVVANSNRVGLRLDGETAYLDSCDISGNSEWGIVSRLTLSLVAVNTYTEHSFLDTLIKAEIKPVYGMEFLGGKKSLRTAGDGLTLADIGQSLAHDVGNPIKNNGSANTINLLPNPLGGGKFSDFGYSASFGVDYDYNDKPNGAIASLVIDSSVVSPIKDCRIDPVKIPANTGISQSLWVKRVSGTGNLGIRLQDASNTIRISVIDVNESMSPVGEWVKVTFTPRNGATSSETTLANIRYLLYDGVFKVAKHVASVGGHIFDASGTVLTKESGGTITSSKFALPNIPKTKPATNDGALWINGNNIMIANGVLNSGTTAQRPTGVSLGFMYFDTELGKPVYFKEAGVWVDSTGATV